MLPVFAGSIAARAESNPCARYGISLPLRASVPVDSLPFSVLVNYRQIRYQPVDLVGDYSLARHVKVTPVKVAWMLSSRKPLPDPRASGLPGRLCAEALFDLPPQPEPVYEEGGAIFWSPSDKEKDAIEDLDLFERARRRLHDLTEDGAIYLEGHRNPIRVANMVTMLTQVIHEERLNGIEPRLGEPHRWSDEFKRRYGARFIPYIGASKLLAALSRGETARYMATGTEDALESWIITLPHRSLTLDRLFRQSYRLNRGDVYLTLLTIENVLARHWLLHDRDKLAVTGRLSSIINSFGRGADQFGSWYHFFGVMLYGYVEGQAKARMIGWIESMGSRVLSRFKDEKQEDFINREGGRVGYRLRKVILERRYLRHRPSPAYLERDFYLDLNEDFRPRLRDVVKDMLDRD